MSMFVHSAGGEAAMVNALEVNELPRFPLTNDLNSSYASLKEEVVFTVVETRHGYTKDLRGMRTHAMIADGTKSGVLYQR